MGFPANHPAIVEAFRRGLVRDVTPAQPAALPFPVAPDCSEKEFQRRVIDLARAHDWLTYHTHDSRRTRLWRPSLWAAVVAELTEA